MGATGPLLKGELERGNTEYTVRFPIHERGYDPEHRPVESLQSLQQQGDQMLSCLPAIRPLPQYQCLYSQTKKTGNLQIPVIRFPPKEMGIQPPELVELDGTTFAIASTYHQKLNISMNTAWNPKIIGPLEWRQKCGPSDI